MHYDLICYMSDIHNTSCERIKIGNYRLFQVIFPDKKVMMKFKFLEKSICNPMDAKIKRVIVTHSHAFVPCSNVPLDINIHISCSLNNHVNGK